MRCSVKIFCALFVAYASFVARTQSQGIEYATLGQLIEQGTQAFAKGNYPTAANAYGKIQELYNEEEDWKSGQLPRKLLPLTGFAALKAGFHEQSIAAFELFLDEYADNYSQKSFSEYALALAMRDQGDSKAAI